MTNAFFPQTLPEKTARLLEQIRQARPSFINSFYLSGGTALSLQLGHRESEDLDFLVKTALILEHSNQNYSRLAL